MNSSTKKTYYLKKSESVKDNVLLVIVSNATRGKSVVCKTFDDWKVLTSLMYIQVHCFNLKCTFSTGASGCIIANANTVNFPLQPTKFSSSRNRGVQNLSKVTNDKTETPFLTEKGKKNPKILHLST